ncbi:MAG: hypothetical protein IJX08_04880 [Clostridia bacterium]|nr:hypothetical protein [Clostridia bacterium]
MKRSCRAAALLLAAVCILGILSGCSSSGGGAGSDNALRIALTGEAFSQEFLSNMNPLYASTEEEYAAGLLLAPTIMQYDEEKGWQAVLGKITVSQEDGRTVATIKLNKGVRYSNDRPASMKDYRSMVVYMLRTGYLGYFKDFYRNPIEGLVACRYNCKSLTLADVPDFEVQIEKELEEVLQEDQTAAKKAYEKMLAESKIFGKFDGNPQTLSPDGRTFKDVLLQDGGKDVPDEYFTASDVSSVMLGDLCALYAKKDRSLWMIEELKLWYMEKLQKDFSDECLARADYVNGTISGMVFTENTPQPLTMKVYFEKLMEDEDEVIRMLNLPLIQSSYTATSTVIGTGSYACAGADSGRVGMMAELKNLEKGRNLSILTMEQEDVFASIYMGQISAAVLSEELSKEDQQYYEEEYGLKFVTIASAVAVYDPDRVSAKELEGFSMLFG